MATRLQKQQEILKNIALVWNEENVKIVEQAQQEINQWKIQTFFIIAYFT